MMKRVLLAAFIALAFGVVLVGFNPSPLAQWSPPAMLSAMPTPAAASYTGPGDVVSGAWGWWGLRAYNSTLANSGASTTAVADLAGSTTGSCTLYLKGDGTGGVDLSTAGAGGIGHPCLLGATTFCSVTNASCSISKLYDQSGNSRPLTQATAAKQPTLLLSGCSSGSLPCMQFTRANVTLLGAGGTTTNPVGSNQSYSSVFKVTDTVDDCYLIGDGSGLIVLSLGGGANIRINAGGAPFLTNTGFSYNTWTSGQFVDDGGGGAAVNEVNGSATTGTINGVGIPNDSIGIGTQGSSSSSNPLSGLVSEAGVWDSTTFSSGQLSSMTSNQRTYWGF